MGAGNSEALTCPLTRRNVIIVQDPITRFECEATTRDEAQATADGKQVLGSIEEAAMADLKFLPSSAFSRSYNYLNTFCGGSTGHFRQRVKEASA